MFWFVLVWGASATVAACVGPLQARTIPRMTRTREWLHHIQDLGFRYLAENTLISGASQLRIYGIGLILSLAAVGYVQVASMLMGPFLVIITAFVGQAILAEAALSYLGLGVQEPVPAWGLMLQGGAEEYASTAPWIAVFPGLAIMLTVFGINLFGDSLRDVLDPKLRDR